MSERIAYRQWQHGVPTLYYVAGVKRKKGDWEYTTDPSKAIGLSDYWCKRFAADCRAVGYTAQFLAQAPRIRCDSCQLARINGVVCHEIGCPNFSSRWDGEAWRKTYECDECGATCDVGVECCADDDTFEPWLGDVRDEVWAIIEARNIYFHGPWRTPGHTEQYLDLRLAIKGNHWEVLSGDVQYDTWHGDRCGVATYDAEQEPTEELAEALAQELLDTL